MLISLAAIPLVSQPGVNTLHPPVLCARLRSQFHRPQDTLYLRISLNPFLERGDGNSDSEREELAAPPLAMRARVAADAGDPIGDAKAPAGAACGMSVSPAGPRCGCRPSAAAACRCCSLGSAMPDADAQLLMPGRRCFTRLAGVGLRLYASSQATRPYTVSRHRRHCFLCAKRRRNWLLLLRRPDQRRA